MGKMLPLQSGQKVDNAIPKAIYIIKNYFFIKENKRNLEICKQYNYKYILIDEKYNISDI